MKKVKVTNIQWDTDGIPQEELNLPSEVEIDIEEATENDFELNQYINDWLSDNYGFCVINYNI